MKRIVDLFFSVLLFVILSPILLLITLIIRLDGGPAIFKQIRVGKNGCEFQMYKFRSMIPDADKFGGYSTSEGDPRITSVGRVLRKTSLDELPQLLNVIAGNMSLIGPRPNVPEQKDEYSEQQWLMRHKVRPGITGLAQATLRSKATWKQRYDLDIRYVDEQSIILDIKIILMTVRQVAFKGGR